MQDLHRLIRAEAARCDAEKCSLPLSVAHRTQYSVFGGRRNGCRCVLSASMHTMQALLDTTLFSCTFEKSPTSLFLLQITQYLLPRIFASPASDGRARDTSTGVAVSTSAPTSTWATSAPTAADLTLPNVCPYAAASAAKASGTALPAADPDMAPRAQRRPIRRSFRGEGRRHSTAHSRPRRGTACNNTEHLA